MKTLPRTALQIYISASLCRSHRNPSTTRHSYTHISVCLRPQWSWVCTMVGRVVWRGGGGYLSATDVCMLCETHHFRLIKSPQSSYLKAAGQVSALHWQPLIWGMYCTSSKEPVQLHTPLPVKVPGLALAQSEPDPACVSTELVVVLVLHTLIIYRNYQGNTITLSEQTNSPRSYLEYESFMMICSLWWN